MPLITDDEIEEIQKQGNAVHKQIARIVERLRATERAVEMAALSTERLEVFRTKEFQALYRKPLARMYMHFAEVEKERP